LNVPSVLRLSRLAVLDGALLTGSIGRIEVARLIQIRERLGRWLAEDDQSE
jgi:mRNA interferase MazF